MPSILLFYVLSIFCSSFGLFICRHESAHFLEEMKHLVLFVERKLETKVKINFVKVINLMTMLFFFCAKMPSIKM